jgi:flagellar basal-body rod protein FlgB
MKIFDTTLARIERSLDVRLARHNVLAANVANVDTPGYSAKDVDFKAAMAAAGGASEGGASGSTESITLAATDESHLGPGAITTGAHHAGDIPTVEAAGSSPSMDGNKVDLDRTMVALAENGLQYGATARAASKKLAILRYVSSDGMG